MCGRIASWAGTILAAGIIAGCAGSADRYPSLALRAAETRPGAAAALEPQRPAAPEPAPTDPARLAALRSAAQGADARFARQQTGTAALVTRARGQPIESDARARAVVALAELSSLRSATFGPLGDLDLLAADRAAALARSDAIDTLRSEVLAMIARQDAILSALWTELEL